MARKSVSVVYETTTGDISYEFPTGDGSGDTTVTDRGGVLRLSDFATDGADVTTILATLVTTAISTKRALDVSGGQWVYSGSGIDLPNGEFLAVLGDIAGKSRITIISDAYLFDCSGRIGGLRVDDLEVVGGKGALRQSWTGIDASAGVMRSFNRCRFIGHSVAAFNINASDSPNWQFRNCYFQAASSTGTMHFAHAGLANDTLFDGCEFGSAQVGIKVAFLNDVSIRGGAFYHTEAADSGVGRWNVWIVPAAGSSSQFGQMMQVIGTKFGNENWSAEDNKVIIAAEGSGDNVGERFPIDDATSSGSVFGLYVTGCKIAYTSTQVRPFIFSTCPNVGFNWSIFGNSWIGAATYAPVGMDTIRFLPALGLTDEPCEFISMKDDEAFYRLGPQATTVEATATSFANVPAPP